MSNKNQRGFTLLEALIATSCLFIGVVGVSGMFAYSTRTNVYSEQMNTGVFLANAKAEELGNKLIPDLPSGGGLDFSSPTAGHFDYLSVAADGTVTSSTGNTQLPFLRMWQIAGTNPKMITVSVYAQWSGVSNAPVELIRATTQVAN
jgi:type II secretory pathway pseudopilin PulG